MIDDSKTQNFKSVERKVAPFNWKALPIQTLLSYRDEIEQVLPPTELSKMNMEQELVLQFHAIRALQNDVIDDDTLPPNQRAQVANAVTSSLNKLSELQIEIYTTERFKAIENLLIRCLSKLPESVAMEFVEGYEKILETQRG